MTHQNLDPDSGLVMHIAGAFHRNERLFSS